MREGNGSGTGSRSARGEEAGRLLIMAGQLGKTGPFDVAKNMEVGRALVAFYGCCQIAADETALLANRYFRVLDLVFATAQRHFALQQQQSNGVSPYTPSTISALAQSPHGEEVFAFLGYILGLYPEFAGLAMGTAADPHGEVGA